MSEQIPTPEALTLKSVIDAYADLQTGMRQFALEFKGFQNNKITNLRSLHNRVISLQGKCSALEAKNRRFIKKQKRRYKLERRQIARLMDELISDVAKFRGLRESIKSEVMRTTNEKRLAELVELDITLVTDIKEIEDELDSAQQQQRENDQVIDMFGGDSDSETEPDDEWETDSDGFGEEDLATLGIRELQDVSINEPQPQDDEE